MRDASGRVYGLMAVALDITDQVRARRVLEAANLQRKEVVEGLESASRAKDEFLAMLGHELRNPLSPILTAVHLMRARDHGCERERAIIERQVEHMMRLVDDLLDVSRIAGGKVAIKKEPIEIAAIVSRAIELASPLLEQKAHVLEVVVPQEGLVIDADPVRLAQVISNLLNNAAKYTDEGGNILLTAAQDGDQAVLTVQDDGRGISAEMLPGVFDLFTQERQNLDRSQGGLGLGLAIGKGLVTLHGGTITAHSAGPGRGSRFVIRLPLAEEGLAQARQKRPGGARPAIATGNVLIVDDNRDAADTLADVVRMFGYDVRVAYDGPSALRVAETFRADVALLDIGLPVMDGYELAERLRALPTMRDVHLIAVTGYGQPGDVDRSIASGFERHIVKPIDVDNFEAALRELVPAVS
jgi:CheY-like chemotaxis protein/nitrogen-specific signal transduction histidine kinase